MLQIRRRVLFGFKSEKGLLFYLKLWKKISRMFFTDF